MHCNQNVSLKSDLPVVLVPRFDPEGYSRLSHWLEHSGKMQHQWHWRFQNHHLSLDRRLEFRVSLGLKKEKLNTLFKKLKMLTLVTLRSDIKQTLFLSLDSKYPGNHCDEEVRRPQTTSTMAKMYGNKHHCRQRSVVINSKFLVSIIPIFKTNGMK